MRSFLTGVTSTSIWTHYSKGGRTFCGHDLPEGMKKNQRLPKAILTPSTKAEKGYHDESVSRAQILELGALSAADFDAAAEMCARVFAFGQQEALRRGLILVDTKYEIGRRPDGTLCFIDEVHTPDSSRYWYADDYDERFARGEEPRGLDKEYVRRTLADQGYKGDGPAAQADRRRPRRGGAPLHPGLRAGHRPPLRARHRRAERAHPEEPEARVARRAGASQGLPSPRPSPASGRGMSDPGPLSRASGRGLG